MSLRDYFAATIPVDPEQVLDVAKSKTLQDEPDLHWMEWAEATLRYRKADAMIAHKEKGE